MTASINATADQPKSTNEMAPGQDRRNRGTRVEIEDRVERTRQLLASGNRKHDVKKALIQAYGISARTCENYIARARELILEASGKPAAEHRAESLAFYSEIKSQPNATNMEKIKAQERIDVLLGLPMPAKFDVSGSLEHSHSGSLILTDLRQELLGHPDVLERHRQAMLDRDAAGELPEMTSTDQAPDNTAAETEESLRKNE